MTDDRALRREVRRVVIEAIHASGKTSEQLAGLAPCSRNTVARIARLENVTIGTIDRLLAAAGVRVRLVVEPQEITTDCARPSAPSCDAP